MANTISDARHLQLVRLADAKRRLVHFISAELGAKCPELTVAEMIEVLQESALDLTRRVTKDEVDG